MILMQVLLLIKPSKVRIVMLVCVSSVILMSFLFSALFHNFKLASKEIIINTCKAAIIPYPILQPRLLAIVNAIIVGPAVAPIPPKTMKPIHVT